MNNASSKTASPQHKAPCSAFEFYRRYKAWLASNPVASRLNAKRLQARRNRAVKGLKRRRKEHWGRIQIRLELALLRAFHSLPNDPNHCPHPHEPAN